MSGEVRHKGRFIKKKELVRRENVRKANIERSKKGREKLFEENRVAASSVCSGNRIVNIQTLAQNLICTKCNQRLGLDRILKETREGLLSIFMIECDKCKQVIRVDTGTYHNVNNEITNHLKSKRHNDITTCAVLGTIEAGLGLTELNKLLACCDIPTLSPSIYKRYEKEVGAAIEYEARQSCKRAAEEERRLVLENLEKLSKELPEEIKKDFFKEWSRALEAHESSNTRAFDRAIGEIVNIIVSYDMGWSKRGNGRSYDSLNGYGAIIGFFSKKVLDYRTRNRKCFSCMLGIPLEKHDCRKNFVGSAKSMEADAGADMITNSSILKEANLNAMVIVGDEDSSLMAAVRNREPLKKFHKLADRNHLKVNFGKKLYILQVDHPELKKKGFISHIKMCFSYAVSQNKGYTENLTKALRAIPHHLYGIHENCGNWCKKVSGKKSAIYKPKFKIKSDNLYLQLLELFDHFAANSQKYSIPASSQGNESLNHIITIRFPKNKSLSTSISGDIRVASGVLSKNEGTRYLILVKITIGLPVTSRFEQFCTKIDLIRMNKTIAAGTLEKKRRRVELKNEREKLKVTQTSSEGLTYEKNLGFDLDEHNFVADKKNCSMVFFDLETSGFSNDADILQIGAICGEKMFSVYIEPTQPIDVSASKVTGLRIVDGDLYLHDKRLVTMSMVDALNSFLSFLKSFDKICLLIAHNAAFDCRFFLREGIKHSLIIEFHQVVYGFCDTLSILKKILPERKGRGMFSLTNLAKDLLDINVKDVEAKFHDAQYDVVVLQKLTEKFITFNIFSENVNRFTKSIHNLRNKADKNVNRNKHKELKNNNLEKKDCHIVIFKIETSERSRQADIIFLEAISDDKLFSVYIESTQEIDKSITDKNGLKVLEGTLYRHDKIVITLAMQQALDAFLSFLISLDKPCFLISHDASCDIHLLIREIVNFNLVNDFSKVLCGFCDVLPIIRSQFPDYKSKEITDIVGLSKDLVDISALIISQESMCRVDILQEFIKKCIPFSLLMSKKKDLSQLAKKIIKNMKSTKNFAPLQNVISDYMLKRISSHFEYNELKKIYFELGETAFLQFYSENVDGKPRITKNMKILKKIAQHFKNMIKE